MGYLTLTEDNDEDCATWSPNGSVAYVDFTEKSLYIIDSINPIKPHESKREKLVKGYGITSPSFSPNGQKIAFQMDGDIYMINPDGSELLQITNTPGEVENTLD
jgi:dipeptidyl aminopeptidase/acylaminoacyl peptidase